MQVECLQEDREAPPGRGSPDGDAKVCKLHYSAAGIWILRAHLNYILLLRVQWTARQVCAAFVSQQVRLLGGGVLHLGMLDQVAAEAGGRRGDLLMYGKGSLADRALLAAAYQ
jgi:hypothetical protein